MQCLTHNESAAWCIENGYPALDSDHSGRPLPSVAGKFREIELAYPVGSGKKVFVANEVIRWFTREDRALLVWITDWGVWPGCEHMPLFTRFREVFGEFRPMIEAPAHLLASQEFKDAASLLIMASIFTWDCHIFSATYGPVFFCSHDEWNGFLIPPNYDSMPLRQTFSKILK